MCIWDVLAIIHQIPELLTSTWTHHSWNISNQSTLSTVGWCVLVPDWSQGVSMLSNQSAVSNDRTSGSEKAWLSVCFFFFPFSTKHTLLLLFQSKSCKTVPESRSMLAHFCSTANQWNSTNSTVICSLHRPPPPYLTMSPPRSLLPPSPLPPCPNLNVPHIPPAGSENKIVWTPHEKG